MMPNRGRRLIAALGLVAAVGGPALLIRAGVIDAATARILTLGAVNAVLAISVHVLTGITGLLSLGQAAFMTLGAYLCVFFTADLGLPLPLGVALSSIMIAALGCLLGIPSLRLSGDYLALVTLGFGEIVYIILGNLTSLTGGSGGRQFEKSLAPYPSLSFLTVTLSLALILLLLRAYLKSAPGRSFRSVREDEIAANSYGISIAHYKLAGFGISAFIAGLGGCLYVMAVGFIKPDMASFTKSIDYLIYAVFGGLGSMTGAVIAAYALSCLSEFLKTFGSGSFAALRILGEFRLLIYALILLFVMISRPGGLFGQGGLFFSRRRQDRRGRDRRDRRGSDDRRISTDRRRSSDRRRNNTPSWDNERRNLPDRRDTDRRERHDSRNHPPFLQFPHESRFPVSGGRRPGDRRQHPGDRRGRDGDDGGNPEEQRKPEGRSLPPQKDDDKGDDSR
jgi:branched-chain amino acid transport system permease protein